MRFEKEGGARAIFRTATVAVLAIAVAGTAQAAVQCVGPGGKVPAGQAKKLGCAAVFAHVGDGVAAAAPGDTVAVFPGTYSEMVTIDKAGLLLLGQNTKKTIIDATDQPNGVLDSASNVTISGFTIENAQHEGILVTGPAAICNTDSPPDCHPAGDPITNVTISNNLVTDNDKGIVIGQSGPPTCAGSPDFEQEDCGEGLHIDGVNFSTVTGNTVKGNAGGILITDETNSNVGNLIDANDVEDNTPDCGITLPSHPPNGSGANIGAHSFGVAGNTISNNTSKHNGAAGVGVFTPTPGTSSQKNLIIGNTIADNTEPGVVFHSHAPHQKLNDNAVISNNISGNGADKNPNGPANDGPADPTGIEVYAAPAAEPVIVNATGNTITKETNDIWVGAAGWNNCPDATPCYGMVAELNNLLGKNVGIDNAGTAAAVFVIAPQNYWGCPKGPGQKNCSTAQGNVSTNPFLGSTSKIQ